MSDENWCYHDIKYIEILNWIREFLGRPPPQWRNQSVESETAEGRFFGASKCVETFKNGVEIMKKPAAGGKILGF